MFLGAPLFFLSDPPAYQVFCAGLTLVAVLLVPTWAFNYRYHVSALPEDAAHLRAIAFICALAGIVASFGLPVLVRSLSRLGILEWIALNVTNTLAR